MVDLQLQDGRTALLVSCSYGRDELMSVLLDQGAGLNFQFSRKWLTAFITAANYGNLITARLLLEMIKGLMQTSGTSRDE